MELTMEAPNSPNLEEIVIGTIFLDSTAFYKVSQILRPSSFYIEKNQIIYSAFVELNDNHRPLDLLTVSEYLKTKGQLEKVGGPYGLVETTNKIGSSANLEAHATMLFAYAVRRDLIKASRQVWLAAHDQTKDVMSVLEKARTELFSKTTTAISRVRNVGYHVENIIEESKTMGGKFIEVRGVPTGFQDLDKAISGLIGGRLYIIGGRPSMGKTTFTINVAINAVKKFGKKVLFFSGEMSGKEITSIIMAKQSGKEIKHIQSGMIADWQEVLSQFDQNLNDNLLIDDTPAPSLMHVQSEAIKLKESHDIDCIIVDYLQLMKVNDRSIKDKGAAVSKISGALKELARRLDVPVVALSQLSRGCENRNHPNKRPVMSDLKETGDIEQDADFIAFLYRPEYYDEPMDGIKTKNLAEFIVRKNRQGPLGNYALYMNKPIARFSGYDIRTEYQVPLDHYDMSITQPKDIETITSNYSIEGSDDLPF